MSLDRHRAEAPGDLGFALLITTDRRTEADDATSPRVRTLIETRGFSLRATARSVNEVEAIRRETRRLLGLPGVDAVLVCGGTGFSARDVSVEAVRALVEGDMPGFGELFRALSFAEIGSAAMLTRAYAGVLGRQAVFVLPGSPDAAALALERLILPEVAHLVGQLRLQSGG
jgi:molybdenum cofactor biosynthesis protein B